MIGVFGGGNVTLCFFYAFVVQKTLTLFVQEGLGLGVHDVQVFLVDQQGLVLEPFLPGGADA